MPADEAGKAKRRGDVRESFKRRFMATANEYRDKLREYYGPAADKIQAAEAFENLGVRAEAERGRNQAPVPVLRRALATTPGRFGVCTSRRCRGCRTGAPGSFADRQDDAPIGRQRRHAVVFDRENDVRDARHARSDRDARRRIVGERDPGRRLTRPAGRPGRYAAFAGRSRRLRSAPSGRSRPDGPECPCRLPDRRTTST